MTDNVIGRSAPRRDAVEKVTGRASYTANLSAPRMLHGKILRSPLPHAKIVSIDASRARRLPGVRAVLCRDDLIGNGNISPYYGYVYADQAVVAIDRVRYVGDAVAAIAAVDTETAQEALGLIDVEYEELPAVLSPEAAFEDSSTVIHEEMRPAGADSLRRFPFEPKPGTNICAHLRINHGDAARGFAQADHIFDDAFTTPMQSHCSIEPYVSIAQWHPAGRLTLWSATQQPFQVRDYVAQIFHLPRGHVRVLVDNIGGGYGAKTGVKLEAMAAMLAKMSACPVKILLTREEVFLTLTRHGSQFSIRTGIKRDGRMVARQIRILWDTGAYADCGPIVAYKAGYTSSGPYNIANVTIDSYCLYTNKPPAGPLRGMGVPQTTWAYEQHLDRIAAELGVDPIELRRKNLYVSGDTFLSGETLRSINIVGCLDKALETVDWPSLGRPDRHASADPTKARGRGVACGMKNTATPTFSGATIKLNDDGTALLLTGTVEVGQGAKTAMAQIAAEALGLPLERVVVGTTDTDAAPYDFGTVSGRSVFHVGKAIVRAAQSMREQLISLAADALEASPEDLEIGDGRVFMGGAPEQGLTFEEVLLRHMGIKGSSLVAQGEYRTHMYKVDPNIEGCSSPFWDMGIGIAEVEVDCETGEVRVLRYSCVADVGKAINPALVYGQLSGSTLLGLGQALFEQLLFDNGQPINPSLVNYKIPSSRDIPEELQVNFIESLHHDGPYGAKGIGETGVFPAAPAVANAIYDAVGVRITDLPITPEKVLRALEAARA